MTQNAIPDTLYHYYRDVPFRTLSELSASDRSSVLTRLSKTRQLPYRLEHADYMPRRRAIEQQIRQTFIDKGGRPTRQHPHYMILGASMLWERMEPKVVTVPLEAFPSATISFTYTDSFYTFSQETLRGVRISPKPHRNTVYRLEELRGAVQTFGLPPGYSDRDEPFDVYIEAQVWDDTPLAKWIA